MPGIAWANQPLDLVVRAGATFSLFVFRRAADLTIVDVTGATARMAAKHTERDGDVTTLFDTTGTVGASATVATRTIDGESIKGIQVTVPASAMVHGVYDHDFKITLSGGTPAYWFRGKLTVEAAVTP